MAETGWLTRSLEQKAPYLMDYQGEIGGEGVKDAFLSILNFILTCRQSTSSPSSKSG